MSIIRRGNMRKGISEISSLAIVLLIAIVALGIVLGVAKPLIENSFDTTHIAKAEKTLEEIDYAIQTIAQEGEGATRIIDISGAGETVVLPNEDAIQFELPSAPTGIDVDTRYFNRVNFITGTSVSCSRVDGNSDGTVDLILENEFLKAVFKKKDKTTPIGNFNTNETILILTQKTKNVNITPTNSSIVIDDIPATASGSGYTELLSTGSNLPLCTLHLGMNTTTISYDAYYTLYSGADFIVVEVRNVR